MMNGGGRVGACISTARSTAKHFGANLNTSAANNFHVAAEFDDADASAITVSDVIVFDRMLSKSELDRLWVSFRGLID
jgi:hypothetical protein